MTKRGLFIITLFAILGLIVCVKPAHDNVWDPENPDKATLCGWVYGMNELPVPRAEVFLLADTVVVDSTISGDDGFYQIADIDPGIYKVRAQAPHYVPFECEPESLPAGSVDTFDIWFNAQHYCFEEEALGTVQPFGFDTLWGSWQVKSDTSAPENHTVPNIYCGTKNAGESALTILRLSGPDFYLETELRILPLSDTAWFTGVVFRFQDPLNFYVAGINPHGLVLNRRINGVDTQMKFQSHNFMMDKWYNLIVQMCGQDIHVAAGGIEFNLSDNHLATGKAGLFIGDPPSSGTVKVNFDDVTIGH